MASPAVSSRTKNVWHWKVFRQFRCSSLRRVYSVCILWLLFTWCFKVFNVSEVPVPLTMPLSQPEENETLIDSITRIIPVVIMVFDRVEYLKTCLQSLRDSDLDLKRVPVIISQDGDVPEMTSYVKSLLLNKSDFGIIHRIVHPYSCYDNPNDFPSTLPSNSNSSRVVGERNGNLTCCKHHFTWMLKTVFEDLETVGQYDDFLFLEEDYVVATNFYESILRGVSFLEQTNYSVDIPPTQRLNGPGNPTNLSLFGLALDPTDGYLRTVSKKAFLEDGFFYKVFQTNPIVLNRRTFYQIKRYAKEYCEFNEYNWDWSLVHLQSHELIPRMVLVTSRAQAKHIGVQGMHHSTSSSTHAKSMNTLELPDDFHPAKLYHDRIQYGFLTDKPGFGGWSHPIDHEHCKRLLL